MFARLGDKLNIARRAGAVLASSCAMHRLRITALALVSGIAASCGAPPLSLTASAAFAYPSTVGPSLERVAILVTVVNNSQDDLAIDPAEFAARDASHHVYPANPAATTADASSVRAAAGPLGMSGILPMPVITLRKDDVLTGFVVFDVPAGVRPTELIFRQPDTDTIISLAPSR